MIIQKQYLVEETTMVFLVEIWSRFQMMYDDLWKILKVRKPIDKKF